MKIDSSIKPLGGTNAKEGTTRASVGGKTSTKAPLSQDRVEITSVSTQLQTMGSSQDNVPVVDTARVEAIKQAISEGRFKINPEAIADRLIATAKDLIHSQEG